MAQDALPPASGSNGSRAPRELMEAIMPHRRLLTSATSALVLMLAATVHAAPQAAAPAPRSDAAASALKDLKALPPADQKRFAAGRFLGFYALNGQDTGDVCKAEGVDLTAYVSAFQRKHIPEYAQAGKIMAAAGVTPEQMAAAADRSRLDDNVRHSLLDLAAAIHKTTVADACSFIGAHVDAAVAGQSFAEQNPEIEAVLMAI